MIAFDIGGANLKIADGQGYGRSCPFALWKHPQGLTDALRRMLEAAPESSAVAVTMTGELADCFATKTEGVRFIVEAAERAVGARRLSFYLTDGSFVSAAEARRQPKLAGASNWHALASFAARWLPAAEQVGLLLDVGSTTTDIIPLCRGQVVARGRTDLERLASGELVYTGVLRSPLCAVLSDLTYDGRRYPLCHELFATMRDAYLLVDAVPEDTKDLNTADGRPATKEAARARLARMVAAWEDECGAELTMAMARAAHQAQVELIAAGARQVLLAARTLPSQAIIAGAGEFLARKVLSAVCPACEVISLAQQLGSPVSEAAAAHALAVLARERNSC